MKSIGLVSEIDSEVIIHYYIISQSIGPIFLIWSDMTHTKLDRTKPNLTGAERTRPNPSLIIHILTQPDRLAVFSQITQK